MKVQITYNKDHSAMLVGKALKVVTRNLGYTKKDGEFSISSSGSNYKLVYTPGRRDILFKKFNVTPISFRENYGDLVELYERRVEDFENFTILKN